MTTSNVDSNHAATVQRAAGMWPLFMRRIDAADYLQYRYGLRCSRQTLAKLAVLGGGPIFHHSGRTPLYALSDLDQWANTKIGKPRTLTSDAYAPTQEREIGAG
jgi:hypothetical protein